MRVCVESHVRALEAKGRGLFCEAERRRMKLGLTQKQLTHWPGQHGSRRSVGQTERSEVSNCRESTPDLLSPFLYSLPLL